MNRRTELLSAALVAALSWLPATKGSAQFWHALPTPDAKGVDAAWRSVSFSNDEKKLTYVSKEKGVTNVYMIPFADKYGRITANASTPAVPVTAFTDRGVIRSLHLLTLPEILFMRAEPNGLDAHLFRTKDDGTGTPMDLTPGGAGTTSEMIGASYNGRFVYYRENLQSHDKVDTYRYDAQQYVNDLVFPNDKDYIVEAWSRDHARLLVEDPANGAQMLFDIASTERTPLAKPATGRYVTAVLDPTNTKLIVLEATATPGTNAMRELTIATGEWKELGTGTYRSIDYSPNGKYMILEDATGARTLRETATGTAVSLPEGAELLAVSPKETLIAYGLKQPAGGATRLFLYDPTKKQSTEIGLMH